MDVKKIKKELLNQKQSKFKGNIYHYSQVNFSYNSNKNNSRNRNGKQTKDKFAKYRRKKK